MPIIYHDQSPTLLIPNNWVKDENFKASDVNALNESWNKDVDQGTQYQLISKYERQYEVSERIGRIALGVMLSCTVFIFAFKSGRAWVVELLFLVKDTHIIRKEIIDAPKGELVDINVSMAGNPAHMGHMHMIALAVNRLVKEGYRINKVKIALSEEEYLQNKVKYCNNSIKLHRNDPHGKSEKEIDMLKVFIPKIKRIEFLRAVIKQAKDEKVFDQGLNIDYFDSLLGDSKTPVQKVSKDFLVCGADYAVEMCNMDSEHGNVKHAVIVTRDEKLPNWIVESHTNTYSRLIVSNDKKTKEYSSSKIQNGAYEQLPPSVREAFKKLHQQAQEESMPSSQGSVSPATPLVSLSLDDRYKEIQKFDCPIGRETGIAITRGYYTNSSGKQIPLRSGAELLEGSRVIPNSILKDPVQPTHSECTIVVINRDCLEAAEEELRNGAKRVAVLMLASPVEPGGAMEDGNNGQEEDLCRRSDIFGFMWDQARGLAKTSMYVLVDVKPQEVNPIYSKMQNNRMIHVPQVTVFRSSKNDQYKMLEKPFEVGMLVSPGIESPKYKEEEVNKKKYYARSEDIEQLRKLMMTQLKVAYEENYDTVILGAFGCGAFSNPPELIAEYYKNIIDMYFKGAFKKIVFAIVDNGLKGKHNPEGNFKPFQKCFESKNN